MRRHIFDHDRLRGGGTRAARFARIERAGLANPAAKQLQRRPLKARADARLREYLRLARGPKTWR